MGINVTNSHLNRAGARKFDEYYTLMETVEEVEDYKEFFIGKIIYCNCDNPRWSKFWEYFHRNFSNFQLKGLIATYFDLENAEQWTYTGGNDEDISFADVESLFWNGDFRSDECQDIMEKVDLVITNPPFSLLREFVTLLMEKEKDFLIIGSVVTLATTAIYKYIYEGKCWFGNPHRSKSNKAKYRVPKITENGLDIEAGEDVWIQSAWFTTLECKRRSDLIELTETYEEGKYRVLDNMDVISVNERKQIPKDYDGIMCVPCTFLSFHNPKQFKLCKGIDKNTGKEYLLDDAYLDGKELFKRIYIQRIGD